MHYLNNSFYVFTRLPYLTAGKVKGQVCFSRLQLRNLLHRTANSL